MSDDGRFSLAAYAVIADKRGRILLTRRRTSEDWVLPGGTVRAGEAPWETVGRETSEETGLQVDVERLVGVYTKRRERDVVFVFEATRTGGDLRPSDERDRVEFVDPPALPEHTSSWDRERIADALRRFITPVLSVQPSAGEEPPEGVR